MERVGELIIYVGEDQAYFDSLQELFRKQYPGRSMQFRRVFKKSASQIKQLLIEIVQVLPDIVFVDYSKHTDQCLALARDLQDETSTRKKTIIGLCSNTHKDETFQKALSLGVVLNHVKGIEYQDVVYHAATKCFPEQVQEPSHALASTRLDVTARNYFRVGFVTKDYIHLETNFSFEIGDEISLKSGLFDGLEITDIYKVIRAGRSNLYYPFRRWYDLEHVYLDEFKLRSIESRVKEVEEQIEINKKDRGAKYDLAILKTELEGRLKSLKETSERLPLQIEAWIESRIQQSESKRTRVVVIDRELKLLDVAEEDLRKSYFSIRYFTHLGEKSNAIDRLRPGIIAFEYETNVPDNNEGESKKRTLPDFCPLNNQEALGMLFSYIKAIEGYSPIVVLFNCQLSLENLKKQTGHEHIIIHREPMELEMIRNLVLSYEKMNGRSKTHDPSKSFDAKEKRLYIPKTDFRSLIAYNFFVTIHSVSESEVLFSSEVEIPLNTPISIDSPIKIYCTTVNIREKDVVEELTGKLYRGLIHGVNEVEKNKLRTFVNSIFFKDKDAQKEAELKEFEDLKQQKLKESSDTKKKDSGEQEN